MKSIVLCSSRRFRDEAFSFLDKLEKLGVSVLRPQLKIWTDDEWGVLTREQKQAEVSVLTLAHFEKIDKADVVFLYNKDGYSGVSVTLELAYGHAKEKPIYALSEDREYARNALYAGFASSPEELFKFLK